MKNKHQLSYELDNQPGFSRMNNSTHESCQPSALGKSIHAWFTPYVNDSWVKNRLIVNLSTHNSTNKSEYVCELVSTEHHAMVIRPKDQWINDHFTVAQEQHCTATWGHISGSPFMNNARSSAQTGRQIGCGATLVTALPPVCRVLGQIFASHFFVSHIFVRKSSIAFLRLRKINVRILKSLIALSVLRTRIITIGKCACTKIWATNICLHEEMYNK